MRHGDPGRGLRGVRAARLVPRRTARRLARHALRAIRRARAPCRFHRGRGPDAQSRCVRGAGRHLPPDEAAVQPHEPARVRSNSGYASCTGLSILLAAACRSPSGIPARHRRHPALARRVGQPHLGGGLGPRQRGTSSVRRSRGPTTSAGSTTARAARAPDHPILAARTTAVARRTSSSSWDRGEHVRFPPTT